MGKIHKLPDQVIAQIAAGEVIERPAYALKELIENAIDAKADRIQVFLEQSGFKKILVIDNGEGMDEIDLKESFKHHTTSKITNNISNIESLGFRGEALSSIAAISTVTIKSRVKNLESGNQIVIKQGLVHGFLSIGTPFGTSVLIEQLFSGTPVRKRFLKNMRSEMVLNNEIFLKTVINYPNIHFTLSHNGRILYDFPKIQHNEERIKKLLGEDIFSELIPVDYNDETIKINGWISKPTIVSSNKNKQYMSINRRQIDDKKISQSVKQGYGDLIDSQTYPIFVLMITLPYNHVDVNIHPRKQEVAFINQDIVYKIIIQSVGKALTSHNLTPFLHQYSHKMFKTMPDHATSVLRDELSSWEWLHITKVIRSSPVMQIHKTYIVASTYNGILLIDQHAAHERIVYETLRKTFIKKKKYSSLHSLSTPIILELSVDDFHTAIQKQTVYETYGFHYKEFGRNAIAITDIPTLLKDHNIPFLFQEILQNIEQWTKKSIDYQSEMMLQFLSCRSAIKAGDILTQRECKKLIEELDRTENNYTCPHGRPTKTELSLSYINKLFKR